MAIPAQLKTIPGRVIFFLRLLFALFGLAATMAIAHASTVATPSFSPAAGTYTSAQTVTITSTTSGSSIRYTTNGTAPTSTSGTVYSSPVSISVTTKLEAIAYKSGSTSSSVTSGTYTINLPTAVAPTFSPVAGTYTSVQTVTITTTTSGASIHYTTDGSTPSATAGTLYSTPVSIGVTTTLKAIAFKTNFNNSSVTSGTYTINLPTAVAPTFSPVAGTYTSPQTVTITTTTSGASIHYTTDGSTPSATAGTLYSAPVSIGVTTTLKAIAFKTNFNSSTVTSGVYTINLPTAVAPTFSPVAGTYTTTQNITITTTTSGASIHYTTDGSTPSATAGTLYSAPVSIGTTTTLKAIVFKTNFNNSSVTSGTYTINLPTAVAPTFSPVAGTYTTTQNVTITTTTSGASIHYTTDGSTPSATAGTLYSAPVSIGATTTLKAIVFKTNFNNSSVTSGTYTINLPTAVAPTFSPVAGTYTSPQTVTVSSTTSGASIAYTTDGSTPTASGGTITHGSLYSPPLIISATTTLTAIVFGPGYTPSTATSGKYTINLPKATAPTFNPVAGSYTGALNVDINWKTSGASIAYTTDGSTPTANGGTITHGILYSSAVAISATTTLEAIAFETGYTPSSVTSGAYTIAVVAPVFSLPAGTYATGSAQSVVITSATSGATIRYTTNGTAPTSTTGTIYSGPVSIGATTTLEAIAYETGLVNSTVTTGVYTFAPAAAAPTFSPTAGTYTSAQTVTITSATTGASIHYTIDGSIPTEANGTLYSGPVSLNGTTLFKAIAYKSAMADSPVTSGFYTIGSPAVILNVLSNNGASGNLVQGSDGNFYGTTDNGDYADGSVFKLTPAGVLTTLTSFNGVNGNGPEGLLQGSDGSFYGTTLFGGNFDDGTVFKMTPAGALTTLVSFNGANGNGPRAGLVQGSDGNFYGTTQGGGSSDDGTVFKMTSAGVLTSLVSFTGANGAYPYSSLVQGSDGNFYGTTSGGGSNDDGTVFTLNSTGGVWTLTTLVSFNGAIGSLSEAALVQGSDGNYYGTTQGGGVNAEGTIFMMTPTGVLTTLVDGAGSGTALVQGSNGNFYGTTYTGGSSNAGTVFQMTPAGVLTTLVSFDGANGGYPQAALVQGSDGNFYGAVGLVFQLIIPQATAPVFSPAASTYTSIQTVTITSATNGTSIRYTTDGSTPTETSGTLYSGPVSIGTTATLKAIAYENGCTDSAVTSGTYTINLPPAAAPTFSPPAGTYMNEQMVTITSATSGTSIIYTTDGTMPIEANGTVINGTLYGTPVPIITTTTTLNAIAFETGYADSPVTSGIYTITNPPPSAPVFSPPGGTYVGAQSVTITSTGATAIYYTTDGSTPTTFSTLYNNTPVSISNNTVLQAIGVNGGGPSLVTSASFTIHLPAPVFSPEAGAYANVTTLSVAISDADSATIYYTTNGTTPTTSSTQYSAAIALPLGATKVSAIAVNALGTSTVSTGTFVLTPPPPQSPVFSPAGGIYTSAQSVAITSSSSTAIYYTTDGSLPTTSSTLYTAAVPVTTGTVVQAIGVNSGGPSPVASASFTILPPAPVFSPAPGTYTNITSLSVAISDVAGATIYYTTDGTTPTTASTRYTAAVSLPLGTTTLKAIATVGGLPTSTVTGGIYTIINIPSAAAPIFSLAPGHAVAITSATSGVSIRYTIDGSTPTETNGTLYSAPVGISAPTTLKAIAYKTGFTDSPVTSTTIGVRTITIVTPTN